MGLKRVLKKVDFSVPSVEFKEIKEESEWLVKKLKESIRKNRIDAEVFVGGSFAKGTLAKSEEYDIDIFIRFGLKIEDLSKSLKKIIGEIKEYKKEEIHGSRDYYRLYKNKKITFEIIPVSRIKKPGEEKNVTDLSYFHVNYVKNKLKKNMIKELQLAKTFFKANGFYGAESYIQGFSGYSLECLIIYYKTFERLLKSLCKVKKENKLIIDLEKRYKNKKETLIELNESKTQSPVILVDPTWKERNALAALSGKRFEEFVKVAKKFLKNPSEKYFVKAEISPLRIMEEARRKKAEFLEIKVKTNRQEGDIAGTKLKKFANFLEGELGKRYVLLKSYFRYDGKQKAESYLIVKSKKEIIKRGPPVKMEYAVRAFKKENNKTFVKNGKYYSKIKVNNKARDFLRLWIGNNDNRRLMNDMGIVDLEI